MRRVYLDHNASTPVHPDVLAAMLPYVSERFGNASSIHGFGREARDAVVHQVEIKVHAAVEGGSRKREAGLQVGVLRIRRDEHPELAAAQILTHAPGIHRALTLASGRYAVNARSPFRALARTRAGRVTR